MTNSMVPVIIKPAFNFMRGETFVFGTWVCVSDGAGSFNRFHASTPETITAAFQEAVEQDVAENFGEISL